MVIIFWKKEVSFSGRKAYSIIYRWNDQIPGICFKIFKIKKEKKSEGEMK